MRPSVRPPSSLLYLVTLVLLSVYLIVLRSDHRGIGGITFAATLLLDIGTRFAFVDEESIGARNHLLDNYFLCPLVSETNQTQVKFHFCISARQGKL
jgi:hypothetical protein